MLRKNAKNEKGPKLKYLYQPNPNYLYFRMANGKLHPLPLDQDSAEFKTQYASCLALRTPKSDPPSTPPRPQLNAAVAFVGGTVGAGITKYKSSNAPKGFKQKSASTQSCYGYALDVMRDKIGDIELRTYDVNALDRYLELIAEEFTGATADLHRALFSLIWNTCRKFPEFRIAKMPNPTREADKHYKKKQSHRPWTPEELALFNRTASQDLKDAVLVAMFSMQRAGDCIKMKLSDFDGSGISLTPEKDKDDGMPRVFWSPCVKPLRDRLLEIQQQNRKTNQPQEFILTNMWGQPWSSSATVGNAVRKHLIDIKLAAPGKKTISMHGLRATGATMLADMGFSLLDIQAMTNHMSDRMARLYISNASQKIRAQRVSALWEAELEKIVADAQVKSAKAKRGNLKVVS